MEHDLISSASRERLPGTPEPDHIWVGNGGISLAVDTWGTSDGTPVILLHGGGQTRHSWSGTGECLGGAGYYVAAFDARGHGDSGWDEGVDYSDDAMVGDLKAVARQLGGRPPVLVGASMGGIVSLIAAGEGHVAASGLVLVDVAPTLDKSGVQRVLDFMQQAPHGFSSLEEVATAIAAYQPQRSRQPNLEGLAKNVRRTRDGRFHWHWDPRWSVYSGDGEQRVRRLEACSRRLTVPTLLVRGGLSDVLTERGVQDFLALCPAAEFLNVPGAAHMVAGDRNDIFGAALMDFLQRAVTSSVATDRRPG